MRDRVLSLSDDEFRELLRLLTRKYGEDVAQETLARMLAQPHLITNPKAYSFIAGLSIKLEWGRRFTRGKRVFKPEHFPTTSPPNQEHRAILRQICTLLEPRYLASLTDQWPDSVTNENTQRTIRRRARMALCLRLGIPISRPRVSRRAARGDSPP